MKTFYRTIYVLALVVILALKILSAPDMREAMSIMSTTILVTVLWFKFWDSIHKPEIAKGAKNE